MSEEIKNYLGIAILVAVLVFAYAVVRYVETYARVVEPSSFRSFSASGEGKVVAVPDVATFTFSVVSEGGKDLGDIQQENIKKVNQVIAFVKSNGVDAKDVQTEGYNVSPRYQYYSCREPLPSSKATPCPPPDIVGYTVTQTVLVKVRDFSKVGDIVGGVVENGANSVSRLSFTIDDRTKVEQEAREQAIAKAKEKAFEIADAGGFRVGRLLGIDEGYQPYYPAAYGMGGGADFETPKATYTPPTIEPGSQEIVVTVNMRYEIK